LKLEVFCTWNENCKICDWHADTDIATYSVSDELNSSYKKDNMFDGNIGSFWHSKDHSNQFVLIQFKVNYISTKIDSNRLILFQKQVVLSKVVITRRSNCCKDRYANVCLGTEVLLV